MRGGYVVRDANGQAIAYLYSRDTDSEEVHRHRPRHIATHRCEVCERPFGAMGEGNVRST
jgi:hypothetical protein